MSHVWLKQTQFTINDVDEALRLIELIGVKCDLVIHIISHAVGDPGLPMVDLPLSE